MINKIKDTFKHSFFRFAVVGGLGTITNLTIFYIFVDVLGLWANVISVTAFIIAGTQNYILHHIWTFNKITCGKKFSFYDWLKFNLATLVGLVITLLVLNIILFFYTVPLKVIAQGCGVICGTVFNYIGSKYFVFNADKLQKQRNA